MLVSETIISDFPIKRAEREMDERRRVGHHLQNSLAAIDFFLNFVAVPAAFVVAQNLVCFEIKLKDTAHFAQFGARYRPINEITDKCEENYYRHWKTHQ